MQKFLKNKKFVWGGVGLVVIIVLLVGVMVMRKGSTKDNQQASNQPTEEVIPTVDSSVKVDLKKPVGSKDVDLSIDAIPKGTQSIEYSLSYSTAQQGIQGVIGTVTLEDGQNTYDKKDIVLGTCSSGTCVYHQVVGKITVSLKFTGSYGSKVFEKDYQL